MSERSEQGSNHDVLLLSINGSGSEVLRGVLGQAGISVVVTTAFDEIESLAARFDSPILLIDGGARDVLPTVNELLIADSLYRYPIVVVGRKARVHEDNLNQKFLLTIALDAPVLPARIVETIRYVGRELDQVRKRVTAPPRSASGDTSTPVTPTPSIRPGLSIPEVLMGVLEKRGLMGKSFGGAALLSLHRVDVVQTECLGPLASRFVERSHILGKWSLGHLTRTAFLSEKLAEIAQFSKEDQELIARAAYLLGVGIDPGQRKLLQVDYVRTNLSGVRKDLCSRLKDSAMRVGVEYQCPIESSVIATVARQIGGEEAPTDDRIPMLAALLACSEFTDRIVYANGHWSPRAAYTLLRKFKIGECNDFHPFAMALGMKFVSEALAASPPSFLLNERIRENPQLVAEAERNRNEPVAEGEQKIAIEELAPGMRLSRPLKAFDGRQILSEDLVLDQDLIWRIWQLSAIRPLNAPMVVSASKETRGPA